MKRIVVVANILQHLEVTNDFLMAFYGRLNVELHDHARLWAVMTTTFLGLMRSGLLRVERLEDRPVSKIGDHLHSQNRPHSVRGHGNEELPDAAVTVQGNRHIVRLQRWQGVSL